MTVCQNRMFCECLMRIPYPRATRETQLSPSVLTLRIPVMCRTHASFRGMLSRRLPAKILLSSIAWVFTHFLSITQPLQLNPTINTEYKRLNKITIKFDMELRPTKHVVVNYIYTKKNVFDMKETSSNVPFFEYFENHFEWHKQSCVVTKKIGQRKIPRK